MLEIRDLTNKEYVDNELVSFQYLINCSEDVDREDEDHKYIRCIFTRIYREASDSMLPFWLLEVNIPSYTSNSIHGTQVHTYRFVYQTPKNNMPITTIAAMGLYNLQNVIKQEVQYKTMLDFNISEILKGMV